MRAIWAVFAALVVLSCSEADNRPPESPLAPNSETLEQGVEISRTEYGADWPYTVEAGLLYCDPPGSNVVLKVGDQVYALNGRAMGNADERGYLIARDTITQRDNHGYFTLGDVPGIISRGLSMCE